MRERHRAVKSANATLFALVTSVFSYALMQTMVVPAVGLLQHFFYLALPAYAQLKPGPAGIGFGATVTVSGLLMLPGALILLPTGTAVGKLAERFGPRRPAVLGFAVAVAGSALLALAHASMWEHLIFYTVVGAGSGLVMASLPKLIGDLVPLARTGVAAAPFAVRHAHGREPERVQQARA